MPRLFLTYFGAFHARIDDQKITNFRSSNTEGLLVYLTLQPEIIHSREVLATLFWPNTDTAKARKNLSQSLFQLKRIVLGHFFDDDAFIVTTNKTVQFKRSDQYILDADQFMEAVEKEDWQTATSLYTGPLLVGFEVGSELFQQWLRVEQAHYETRVLLALEKRAEELLHLRDFLGTQEAAQKQLDIDSAREIAHRQIMIAKAMSGDRSGALAQYDRCFDEVSEFGVEPSDETEALYEKIVTNVFSQQTLKSLLPIPPTTFVGRTIECNHIIQNLNRPDCQLLSLVGTGGVGKTRIAIEVASIYQIQTQHRAIFVSLLGVVTLAEAIRTIANELGVTPSRIESSLASFVATFNLDTPLLLVLDNVETLFSKEPTEVGGVINALCGLDNLKLLLTARFPLKLIREWTFNIGGLNVPSLTEPIHLDNWSQYSALDLFVQRAQQAQISFRANENNLATIAQICAYLEGNPLGIEIAASNVNHQTTAELLSIIEMQPESLEINRIDFPARHRTLFAVFQQSWNQITTVEQHVLSGCAVFEGGFSRAAARAVLEDDVDELETLVEKSLLRKQSSFSAPTRIRYFLNPLLKNFIRRNHPPDEDHYSRHADYYLNYAITYKDDLDDEEGNVANALHWIERQQDDLRLSQWASITIRKPTYTQIQLKQSHLPLLPPFFAGREKELALLRQHIQSLINNETNGGAWNVMGEAGIGKSSLIYQLQNEFKTVSWFECRCTENNDRSFYPFRQWLYNYFGQSFDESAQYNLQQFSKRLDDIVHAVADVTLKNELARLSSFLAALVDIHLPNSIYSYIKPEQRKENFIQAIKTLIKAESRLMPVLILIEDAHWMDSDSRNLVNQLFIHVETERFAMLMTARPVQFEPLLLNDLPTLSIQLLPLEQDITVRIATYYLGIEPHPEIVELLRSWCQGNPLYTQQLLFYMLDNQIVVNGHLVDKYRMTNIDTHLPINLNNLLVARFNQLDPDIKELVEQASVLGNEFPLSVLRHMSADPLLEEKVSQLIRSGIWQPVNNERYVFGHVLLKNAAYDSQFHQRKKQLHNEAAQAISATAKNQHALFAQIALHYDEAQKDDLAVVNYIRAGDQARNNYFVTEANRLYSRGLDLAKNEKHLIPLLLGREKINHWLGNREQQEEDLQALLKITANSPDSKLLAEIAIRRASYYLVIGQYEDAVLHAQRAVSMAVAEGDKIMEAEAMHKWGRAIWQGGNPRAAEPILERGLILAQSANDTETQANCLYDLSILAYYRHEYDVIVEHLSQALPLFEELDNKRRVIRCVNMLGLVENARGNFEQALDHYQQSVDLCRMVDWVYGEAHMLSHLGNCYFELGDYKQSRQIHEKALAMSQESSDPENELHCLDSIGLTYQFEGNPKQARVHFERALALATQLNNVNLEAYCLTHLGLCLIDFEEIEQASLYLYKAISLRHSQQSAQMQIDTQAALAWLDLARGNISFAVHKANQIVEAIEKHGLQGIELPLQVLWQCIMIYRSTDENQAAESLLRKAYDLLMSRVAMIQQEARRQTFLGKNPYHQKIMLMVQSLENPLS